ncbi:MAG: hypothetical protein AAF614_40065, partial [Chloroflexota bacterium]
FLSYAIFKVIFETMYLINDRKTLFTDLDVGWHVHRFPVGESLVPTTSVAVQRVKQALGRVIGKAIEF